MKIAMEFDNRRNIETFRKLENVLLGLNEPFFEYLFKVPVSNLLVFINKKMYAQINIAQPFQLNNYFELLVSISMRHLYNKVYFTKNLAKQKGRCQQGLS